MTAFTFDPTTIVGDINSALEAANSVLPTILPVIGTFYPPAAALTPFLPLLGILLQDVQLVEKQMGLAPAAAAAVVAAHITPGQANSPVLGPAN